MRQVTKLVLIGLAIAFTLPTSAHAAVQLAYELDGNDPEKVFGTIDLEDNSSGGVNVVIAADIDALVGGDIREWYFNLPATFSDLAENDFLLSSLIDQDGNEISNTAILSGGKKEKGSKKKRGKTNRGGNGKLGKAGAEFQWGVSFGNGQGPNGNGMLTTASFTIDTTKGLTLDDFLDAPLAEPNNTPAVLMAVHFQSTGPNGEGSETVGGVWSAGDPYDSNNDNSAGHHPEPAALVVWSGLLACCGLFFARRRRRSGS